MVHLILGGGLGSIRSLPLQGWIQMFSRHTPAKLLAQTILHMTINAFTQMMQHMCSALCDQNNHVTKFKHITHFIHTFYCTGYNQHLLWSGFYS